MESDDVIKIVWVVLALVLALSEIFVPGFFLLPFGLGAAAAAIVAFAGGAFWLQLVVFIVASAAIFAALRPVARRLNLVEDPRGVGANRLLHEPGVVTNRVGPDDPGMVRIDREVWRAEAADGLVLEVGTRVTVLEVRGTRVIVAPLLPGNEVRQQPSSGGVQ